MDTQKEMDTRPFGYLDILASRRSSTNISFYGKYGARLVPSRPYSALVPSQLVTWVPKNNPAPQKDRRKTLTKPQTVATLVRKENPPNDGLRRK